MEDIKTKQPTIKPVTKQDTVQKNKQSDTSSDSDNDDQMILWYNIPKTTVTHNIPTSTESQVNTSIDTTYTD